MTTVKQKFSRLRRGRIADIGMALFTLLVAGVLFVGTIGMDTRGNQVPGPQFFPFLVSALLFIMGIVLLIGQLRAKTDEPTWHRPDIAEDMLRDLGANTELVRIDDDKRRAAEARAKAANDDPDTAHPVDWRTVGLVAGAIVLFIATLQLVGWVFAAAAMFWIICYAFGSKRPIFNIGVSLAIASIVQLLFVAGLGLTLPSGFLGVFF